MGGTRIIANMQLKNRLKLKDVKALTITWNLKILDIKIQKIIIMKQIIHHIDYLLMRLQIIIIKKTIKIKNLLFIS